jgi:hypothetical protein
MLACACAASLLLHAGGGLAAARQAKGIPTDLPLDGYALKQLSDIGVAPAARQPGKPGSGSISAAIHVISGAGIARSSAATSTNALHPVSSPQAACARLPQPAVPGYHEVDARIAWQARPGVERALTGRHRQLAERGAFASVSEGPR